MSCLHVDGTSAWVGATIVRANDPSLLGLETVFLFQDLVDRRNDGLDSDRVAVLPPMPASDCVLEPLEDPPVPLISGNYTVS